MVWKGSSLFTTTTSLVAFSSSSSSRRWSMLTENRLDSCYSNYLPLIFLVVESRFGFSAPSSPRIPRDTMTRSRKEICKKCGQITHSRSPPNYSGKCQELWAVICIFEEFLITANICKSDCKPQWQWRCRCGNLKIHFTEQRFHSTFRWKFLMPFRKFLAFDYL